MVYRVYYWPTYGAESAADVFIVDTLTMNDALVVLTLVYGYMYDDAYCGVIVTI